MLKVKNEQFDKEVNNMLFTSADGQYEISFSPIDKPEEKQEHKKKKEEKNDKQESYQT